MHVSTPCKIDIAQDDNVPLHHTVHLTTLQARTTESCDDLYLFLPERPYKPHAMYARTKLAAKKPVRPGRYCSAGPAGKVQNVSSHLLATGRTSKTIAAAGPCKPPVKAFAAGAKGLAIANRKFSMVSAMSGLNPRSQQVTARRYVEKEG